jgi:hypothetical protein
MPKGNIDHAGNFGQCLFVLSELIYYEFNGAVTNDSYVRRNQKCTRFWSRLYKDGSRQRFVKVCT